MLLDDEFRAEGAAAACNFFVGGAAAAGEGDALAFDSVSTPSMGVAAAGRLAPAFGVSSMGLSVILCVLCRLLGLSLVVSITKRSYLWTQSRELEKVYVVNVLSFSFVYTFPLYIAP